MNLRVIEVGTFIVKYNCIYNADIGTLNMAACKLYKILMNKSHSLIYFFLLMILTSCNNNTNSNSTANEKKANKSASVDSSVKLKAIVFFGNSLTAGYGVDPSEVYPALIQNTIDSLMLNYKVINAGVSGETSSGGNGRIEWILRQPVDVFVLELGGNDGLRGIPLSETRKNLQAIIDKVKAKYPDVKIVLEGMQIPPNMGEQYATEFKNIYPEIASKNNAALIPFLLKNVGGDVKLNQPDGIHPTPEGHKIVAQNVWEVLRKIL